MAVFSAVSGNRGYYADMLKVCRISCCFLVYCFFKQAVRQESCGRFCRFCFFALVLCLFPDFYGVFLFDRKVFFCGCDSLDDPKPGMPVTGLFCRKRFA